MARLTDEQIVAIKSWLEVAREQRSNVVQLARTDLEALLADLEEARAALALCRETLGLIETDGRYPRSPELGPVGALCQRYGYGAVMACAASLWREIDAIGAKTVGPCAYLVKEALAATEEQP